MILLNNLASFSNIAHRSSYQKFLPKMCPETSSRPCVCKELSSTFLRK